jgi:serine/threonine protein kinase
MEHRVVKKKGFLFFSGDSIDSDNTSATDDAYDEDSEISDNYDIDLDKLGLSITQDFTHQVLTFREEVLNKTAAEEIEEIINRSNTNEEEEEAAFSSSNNESFSDNEDQDDDRNLPSYRRKIQNNDTYKNREANDMIAWRTPRRDDSNANKNGSNQINFNNNNNKKNISKLKSSIGRLDEYLLPKTESITVEDVNDTDLKYLEQFAATPRCASTSPISNSKTPTPAPGNAGENIKVWGNSHDSVYEKKYNENNSAEKGGNYETPTPPNSMQRHKNLKHVTKTNNIEQFISPLKLEEVGNNSRNNANIRLNLNYDNKRTRGVNDNETIFKLQHARSNTSSVSMLTKMGEKRQGNLQTSPILAAGYDSNGNKGDVRLVKKSLLRTYNNKNQEQHVIASQIRPSSAPINQKQSYYRSGRKFLSHNYHRAGRNVGFYSNRISMSKRDIKPHGLGSPEFQKRLVEAAENVVTFDDDKNGPVNGNVNDNNDDDKMAPKDAQVQMKELRDHMTQLLFQLNECRTFQEERKSHSPSDISNLVLDKMNKRMQSVSIPVPESPRINNKNNNNNRVDAKPEENNIPRLIPKLFPSKSIDLANSKKNIYEKNNDFAADFKKLSVDSNIEFVASRRSKTFEPNKLKKQKKKAQQNSTKDNNLDEANKKNSNKHYNINENNIAFKKTKPSVIIPKIHKEKQQIINQRTNQIKQNKLKRHTSNVHDGGAENQLVGRKLEYVKLLGRGASAKVYLAKLFEANDRSDNGGSTARNKNTFDLVAVKQLQTRGGKQSSVDEIGRVLRLEVETLKRLSHRNIVSYRGMHFSKRRKEYHILMEYVDGGSLADAVKRFPKGIIHDELVRIVTQIVDGLVYLHSQHVIHRDLKPANILFSRKGVVKIADFDISTQVCGLNTKQRSCVGTPWYTAPEVILVEPYSYSADIWSLGCTVYQLATGVCPYAGYGAVQAMFQMVNNGCPKYPKDFNVRDDLKDFTDNCFARNPKDRATAVELREHTFLCGNWTANFMLPSRKEDKNSKINDIYNVDDDTDEDDEVYSSDFDDDEEEGDYVNLTDSSKKYK